MAMSVGADGSVQVFDPVRQAFLRFDPTGAYVDQVAHGMEQGLPGTDLIADPAGGALFSSSGTFAMRRGTGRDDRFGRR